MLSYLAVVTSCAIMTQIRMLFNNWLLFFFFKLVMDCVII